MSPNSPAGKLAGIRTLRRRFPLGALGLCGLWLCLGLPAARAGEGKTPSRIWSDQFDGWDIEPFCGTGSSPLPAAFFQQGPRLEAGGGGSPAVAKDGTVYVGSGTCLFRISPAGRVELLAGSPGVAGVLDGPADRALLCGISLIALGPREQLYIMEQGAGRVRTLEPREKGPWVVRTLIGGAGKGKRVDGPGETATFENPCGMTLFEDGRVFFMDNSWLRVYQDGKLTTLNTKGGFGHPAWKDDAPNEPPVEPLESAHFRILFTGNCLTSDGKNLLYISDMWNNVLRMIDLQKGEVSVINGGPPRQKPGSGTPKGSDPFRDGQGMEMRFHPGGGVTTALLDRATGNIYMGIADDKPHVRTPDGWIRTLKDEVGLPAAFDAEGRVYAGGGGGLRRLRKLKPGEAPYKAAEPPAEESNLFKAAPFDPNSIPKDLERLVIPAPAQAPVIDGKLDDACWKAIQALPLKRHNGSEAEADTATELRFTADQNALYVAFRCLEPRLAAMPDSARNRDDDNFYNDDYVEFFLLPTYDPREKAYQVMVNNVGQTWEGLNRLPKAWNPQLTVKTLRGEGAWTVEVALPLSSLAESARGGQWRLNFGRFRPQREGVKERETTWSVLHTKNSHHYERFNVVASGALGGKLP